MGHARGILWAAVAQPRALQHRDSVRAVLDSAFFQLLLSLARSSPTPLTSGSTCGKRGARNGAFAVAYPDQEGQSAVPALS